VILLMCVPAATLAGCSGNGGSAASTPATQSTTVVTGPATATPSPLVPDRLISYCGRRPACDDFATPSGNIRCFATARQGGLVECSIDSGLKPPAPRGTCDLDQNGLVLHAAGGAAPDCRGDPTPAGLDAKIPALAYGKIWHGLGLLVCISRVTGLTCRNSTGHGFFLSRERWHTF
jgi:hypothetical protein